MTQPFSSWVGRCAVSPVVHGKISALHRLEVEEAGEVGVGLQGAANSVPVAKCLVCAIDEVEHLLAREPCREVVIGFVASLLEIIKCGSYAAKRTLDGRGVITWEELF